MLYLGKLLELRFEKETSKISGCMIDSYLLEKVFLISFTSHLYLSANRLCIVSSNIEIE